MYNMVISTNNFNIGTKKRYLVEKEKIQEKERKMEHRFFFFLKLVRSHDCKDLNRTFFIYD